METKKETTFGISQTVFDASQLNREVYEAPIMEAVEIRVEQGFQMSGATPTMLGKPVDEKSW